MCRKLRTDTRGTKQISVVSLGKIETTNPYGRQIPWEKAIRKLMKDFYFTDAQVKRVIESAKDKISLTDGENEKYNKAWKLFKKELMAC